MHTEDLLDPPPVTRALAFAGLAAFAGAAAWGLLRIYADIEHGAVAWGIGALIGFAVVKAGGHGTLLAISAAVLAVLSIGTGKYISYQAVIAEVEQEQAGYAQELYAEIERDAKDWAALGDSPTDDQVETFALAHDYDVDSADAFREQALPQLERFLRDKPTFETWLDEGHATIDVAAQFSFVDYLKEDFHPLDILFVILGLATAYGLVSKHTQALRLAARQDLRHDRESSEECDDAGGTA